MLKSILKIAVAGMLASITIFTAQAQDTGFSVTGVVADPAVTPGGWDNQSQWALADSLGFTVDQANEFNSCQEPNPVNNYNPECNAQEGEACATLTGPECVPIINTVDECEEAGFTNYQTYKTGAKLKGYLCNSIDFADYTEANAFSPAPAFSHWCQSNSCGNEMANDYRELRTKWNSANTNDALCQAKYSTNCQVTTITLAQYEEVLDEVDECSDYPSYQICLAAVALDYEKNATDAALFAEATANSYSAWCGANCNTLTKSAYNNVKSSPAFGLNYTAISSDYTLWGNAQAGAEDAQCRIEYPTNDCDQITKSEYQTVLNTITSCSGYNTGYADCRDATRDKSYGFGDHALYYEAQATTYNAYCNALNSQDCSELTMAQFTSAKTSAINCAAFTDYAECQAAQTKGYALNAEDAALYQTALADTANNAQCITAGSLAVGTSNACGQLTKTQYNGIAVISAANNALTDAISNPANAALITVDTIKSSEAYTNFASNGTACSTVPSDSDLSSNLERFRYFISKANFASNIENISKQLCYATLGHTELTWHNDAPGDYIIAAEDVLNTNTNLTSPDFKRCGFWSKRTAISKASTNQMKGAGNTIIYDIRAQDDTLAFTTPSISSDKGHAVLSYTVAGQEPVSSASMTLSVLGRAADGIITASASDKVVSVDVVKKTNTTDAVYNVFQKTASSSTWRLRNAINDPSSACPAGYSMVKTTNSSTLNTLKAVALKHGTGAGTMPSGHRMEQCANQFLECNAGFSACSNPNGSNWRMRLMIYGENNNKTCGVTRKKAPGNTFHPDKTDWPSGFSMYPDTGQCSDVGSYSGNPRLANGCVGWCWVRVLCRKDGASHTVWQ